MRYKFRKFEEKTYFFGFSTNWYKIPLKFKKIIKKKFFWGIYPGTKSPF
jgi:hypothetical protein